MNTLIFLCVMITVQCISVVKCLTGHVCTRQKAETYEVTYDRAFICPERYTTACGQLDWRRCTKYRVNTCYTPTQKYAIRYKTIDDCCPGWKDAGGGACLTPVCNEVCENDGICHTDANGNVKCICSEKFYGSACQYKKHTLQTILLIAMCIMTLLILLSILGFCGNKYFKKSDANVAMERRRQNSQECQTLLGNSTQTNEETMDTGNDRKTPTSPLEE